MPDNIPIGEWSAAMLTFDYAHRTCIEPCIFRLRFWPRVMRDAPSRYASSGPRKKVGAFTDSSSGPAMKTCLSSDEDRNAQFALGDVAAPLRSPGAGNYGTNLPPETSRNLAVQDKVTFDFSRENVGKLQSLALHRNALPAEPAGTAHQLPPGFGADGNLERAHFV